MSQFPDSVNVIRAARLGSPQLISIVLALESDTDTVLPAMLGRANHAATLERLGSFDDRLAGYLDKPGGMKPLTCSGILDTANRSNRNFQVRQGRHYHVRVTGLTAKVSQTLWQAFIDERPETWALHDHDLRVVDVICDPARHPWSGTSSYEELASSYRPAARRISHEIGLEFASPTSFSLGRLSGSRIHMPVPLPSLVFGSLVDRWNAFCQIPFPPEVRQMAEQMIGISRYELRSIPVSQKGNGLRIGGVGRVDYTVVDEQAQQDRKTLGILQTLADFAFYSGVGIEAAKGMGQCRRLRHW